MQPTSYAITGTPQPPPDLPAVNWWLDNEIIPAYHGFSTIHLQSILEHGLLTSESTGLVYLTPDYGTAARFSLFGSKGVDALAKYRTAAYYMPPLNSCAVLHIDLPNDFVVSNSYWRKEQGRIFQSQTQPRLENRSLYDNYNGTDSEYYEDQEFYVNRGVSADHFKYISFPYLRPVPVFTIAEAMELFSIE